MEKVLSIVAPKPRKKPDIPSSFRMRKTIPDIDRSARSFSGTSSSSSDAWIRVFILSGRYWDHTYMIS